MISISPGSYAAYATWDILRERFDNMHISRGGDVVRHFPGEISIVLGVV